MDDKEDGPPKEKSFKLWIQKTPCARESLLYGSVGSLLFGTGYFLATSRVKRSFDVAVGGFILTNMSVWFYCRYNNAKRRIQQRIVQDGIKQKILYEGSSMDPNLSKRNNSDAEQ
ncbi:cytochrome c oxidase assembly protein COX20, mitochondrial [Hyperolius riggenbachi]|uniref:cytochrome c oxidase assembly protein COX20, mitochondrial n=1 Tax=Hyperolius riggenbachi TaxID=752182 RepID=UPI0035A39DEE